MACPLGVSSPPSSSAPSASSASRARTWGSAALANLDRNLELDRGGVLRSGRPHQRPARRRVQEREAQHVAHAQRAQLRSGGRRAGLTG